MAPSVMEKKASRVRSVVNGGARLGVSDFARSKEWRGQLADLGCVEVVDRSETVGYVMSPDYAQALASYLDQLEEELEDAHIRMMFDSRREYGPALAGDELASAALAELHANERLIEGFLNAG